MARAPGQQSQQATKIPTSSEEDNSDDGSDSAMSRKDVDEDEDSNPPKDVDGDEDKNPPSSDSSTASCREFKLAEIFNNLSVLEKVSVTTPEGEEAVVEMSEHAKFSVGYQKWGETSTTVSDMKKKIEIPKPKRRKKEPLAVLQPPGGIEQSSLPKTGKCKWTYDALSRVLKADHSLNKSSPFVMDEDDEKFMLQMMERDDITVISGGFVDGKQLDRDIWTMEAVGGMMIGDIYHSIKKLESTETGFREVNSEVSMSMNQYSAYLDKLKHQPPIGGVRNPSFNWYDVEMKEQTIDTDKEILRLDDLDLKRWLPLLAANFSDSLKYKHFLPGGKHCMMYPVSPHSRPFTGPYLYIAPPNATTLDYHGTDGTVDSAFLCFEGFQEVMLLRRLSDPDHHDNALEILGANDPENNPTWPTTEQINKCKEWGYCPSVCLLKPGEILHRNKGRLYAIRSMATVRSPCFSIAWDWMYRGTTVNGIRKETEFALRSMKQKTEKNLRKKKGEENKICLGTPELCVLQAARALLPKINKPKQELTKMTSLFHDETSLFHDEAGSTNCYFPPKKVIAEGILAPLKGIVAEQLEIFQGLHEIELLKKNQRLPTSSTLQRWQTLFGQLVQAERPNIQEEPKEFNLDPYGNEGYNCKLCGMELSNIYFHCDGCEQLLSKDFNICASCHMNGRHMTSTVSMGVPDDFGKRHAGINHTGNMRQHNGRGCSCHKGPACRICGFCQGCSCPCHTRFTVHARFFFKPYLENLESVVRSIAQESTD